MRNIVAENKFGKIIGCNGRYELVFSFEDGDVSVKRYFDDYQVADNFISLHRKGRGYALDQVVGLYASNMVNLLGGYKIVRIVSCDNEEFFSIGKLYRPNIETSIGDMLKSCTVLLIQARDRLFVVNSAGDKLDLTHYIHMHQDKEFAMLYNVDTEEYVIGHCGIENNTRLLNDLIRVKNTGGKLEITQRNESAIREFGDGSSQEDIESMTTSEALNVLSCYINDATNNIAPYIERAIQIAITSLKRDMTESDKSKALRDNTEKIVKSVVDTLRKELNSEV